MKKRRGPFYLSLFYLLLGIEAVFILYISFQSHIDISFQNEVFYTIDDYWMNVSDNGNLQSITLPTTLDPGEDYSIRIYRKIPSDFRRVTSIGILTHHQSLVAYVNNDVIYSRIARDDSDTLFNVPPGSVWDIIPLPRNSEGKTLTLVISSKYRDYAGRLNEVHAGTKASLLLYTIDAFGLGFLLSVINCMIGAFLIFLYVFVKRLIHTDKSLYYLGCFTLLSGIWLLSESNLTQLFISSNYTVSAVGYMALMALPIPILLFTGLLKDYHFKKLNAIFIYILLGSNFIILALQLFNIYDFHQTLWFVRLELYLILGITILTLFLELLIYKNREVKIFTVASAVLFLFSIIELFSYNYQSELISGGYFRLGFYLFILILTWAGIKRIVNYMKLSERAIHYRQLAYRDSLTNCRNRIAYEKDLGSIDTDRTVTIFMADMDNMKQINDTYGHQIGDEVIILCSQCLVKIFGRGVYRIGGDEFLCIEYDLATEAIEKLIQAFQEECAKANEDISYPFLMSVGYATFDPSADQSIQDTVKRADRMMYEVKNQLKM
jgi:diguanylate cyclase (GGDEF)-like protein